MRLHNRDTGFRRTRICDGGLKRRVKHLVEDASLSRAIAHRVDGKFVRVEYDICRAWDAPDVDACCGPTYGNQEVQNLVGVGRRSDCLCKWITDKDPSHHRIWGRSSGSTAAGATGHLELSLSEI